MLTALFGPLLLVTACALSDGCCGDTNRYASSDATSGGEHAGEVLRGEASYYGKALNGRRTASGERYDPDEYTAANRSLPFGTRLKVTRLDNGKSVIVRVNDRGPFGHRRRILDLSRQAAKDLDMLGKGLIEVEAEVLP